MEFRRMFTCISLIFNKEWMWKIYATTIFFLTLTNVQSVQHDCVMTSNSLYRFGNVISEFAGLYAFSRSNNCTALMTKEMADILLPYFQITMPIFDKNSFENATWKNVSFREFELSCVKDFQDKYIYLTGLPQNYRCLRTFSSQIRQELALKPEITAKAQSKLRMIRGNGSEPTFVGIHARKGDYNYFLRNLINAVDTDSEYFRKAMSHFRSKYRNLRFVVVSNDMKWCQNNIPNDLNDVYFMGDGVENTPIDDFAILANCNHSIISQSTFSYFSAFLAGGQVVYLANSTKADNPNRKTWNFDDIADENWIPIAADLSKLERH